MKFNVVNIGISCLTSLSAITAFSVSAQIPTSSSYTTVSNPIQVPNFPANASAMHTQFLEQGRIIAESCSIAIANPTNAQTDYWDLFGKISEVCESVMPGQFEQFTAVLNTTRISPATPIDSSCRLASQNPDLIICMGEDNIERQVTSFGFSSNNGAQTEVTTTFSYSTPRMRELSEQGY